MAYPKIDPMIRFMRKVERQPGDGCWLWTGGVSSGYARFGIGPNTTVNAARWIYEQEVGPIPPGWTIDHLCRVTRCVRPDHLEAVTHRVNILRSEGPAALNARKTHCPQGHPYDDENTMISSQGRRVCRECNRQRCREQYRRSRGPT